jgi:hypothetical protein
MILYVVARLISHDARRLLDISDRLDPFGVVAPLKQDVDEQSQPARECAHGHLADIQARVQEGLGGSAACVVARRYAHLEDGR